MTNKSKFALIALLPLINITGVAMAQTEESASALTKARQVVAEFQGQLSGKLQAAMQAGGPVNAIEVCGKEAPLIAETVGRENNLTIKRISNRPRNPTAKPGDQEKEVLDEFAQTMAQQQDAPLEKLMTLDNGQHRYYQGIKIQPLCLNCHGEELASAVENALREYYPDDQATGYKLGDLRGAFVVDLN